MSGSQWGSWCTPCKRKAGVDFGGARNAWWSERFRELQADEYAIRPKYGPEPCFQCGKDMTSAFIYAPWVHAELIGEATATGGSVAKKICSECWYADHEEPPTNRQDEHWTCDICGKELVQVIVVPSTVTYTDDEDEEDNEPVELMVDLRRHVCTQEYATVYVEVAPEWAEDVTYYDDEILEAALGQGYGPDWELDTEIHSDEPAEIVEVEVV